MNKDKTMGPIGTLGTAVSKLLNKIESTYYYNIMQTAILNKYNVASISMPLNWTCGLYVPLADPSVATTVTMKGRA